MLRHVAAAALAAVALAAPVARADGPSNPALKAIMQDMGATLQTLGRQAGDAARNDSSAQLAARLEKLSTDAKAEQPITVSTLPEPQRTQKYDEYKADLDKLVDALKVVEADFKAGDNTAAKLHLKDVQAVMSTGHQAFRPHP
jgi:cytochrome c556